MSRLFVRSGNNAISQTLAAGAGFTGMTFGTVAVVINRTASAASFYAVMGHNNAANTDNVMAMLLNTTSLFDFYFNATDNNTVASLSSTDGWGIIVGTKATGSVATRQHLFKWSTGVWAHNAGPANRANASSFGTALQIGNDLAAFSDYFDGHIAAAMILDKRALSDSECERLTSGLWERWATGPTDWLREFDPTEVIIPGTATGRNIDPSRIKDVTTVGTARSAIRDPPGFRFSARGRRQ
jgi:hypothetical protein